MKYEVFKTNFNVKHHFLLINSKYNLFIDK